MPIPILTESFNGKAHANPNLIDPKSNLTESFDIFPNPSNLIANVLAYLGFLGPRFKYDAHFDSEPSAITKNFE